MIIKSTRLSKGFSQEELAEKSGVSVRTIQRIENGSAPSIESAKQLSKALDLPLTEILTQKSKPNEKDGFLKYRKPLSIAHYLFVALLLPLIMVVYFNIKEMQPGFESVSSSVFPDIILGLSIIWGAFVILTGIFISLNKYRLFCIISSCLGLLVFPFGTVLGLAALFYLTREEALQAFKS